MTNLKSGLSGCKIELLNSNTLRKYSSSREYNKRLELQIKKQSLFSHFVFQNLDSPKIYQVNHGDIISFDMEYISGFSFDEYFSYANVEDVDNVLKSIFGYLDFLIENSKIYHENVSKKIIYEKLISLNVKNIDFLHYIIHTAIDNNLKVPYSFCHGDLTFANIIFHPKRLYLIDFLDSFIDSYLIDFSKLKQDLYYHWNLKIQNCNNLRIYQIYNYLWKKIEERYSKYLNTVSFKILDSMNLLRIEPYLTNDNHRFILKTLVEKTDLYEDFNCSNGREIISIPKHETKVDVDSSKEESLYGS